ncbi:MAG: DinB family protein [Candidatus Sulfotelmatobacter sp.]
MKMTGLFRSELEREAAGTRHVLGRVPEGCNDWKPHEKSMPLGYLATLVATMPSWVAMMVEQDELDMNPPGGSRYKPEDLRTGRELLDAFDRHVAKACEALAKTTDDHLLTPWRLLVAGHVVNEQPRHVMLRDAVFNHLAHHRGQLTVYLRLNGAPVPALYGPSADERGF